VSFLAFWKKKPSPDAESRTLGPGVVDPDDTALAELAIALSAENRQVLLAQRMPRLGGVGLGVLARGMAGVRDLVEAAGRIKVEGDAGNMRGCTLMDWDEASAKDDDFSFQLAIRGEGGTVPSDRLLRRLATAARAPRRNGEKRGSRPDPSTEPVSIHESKIASALLPVARALEERGVRVLAPGGCRDTVLGLTVATHGARGLRELFSILRRAQTAEGKYSLRSGLVVWFAGGHEGPECDFEKWPDWLVCEFALAVTDPPLSEVSKREALAAIADAIVRSDDNDPDAEFVAQRLHRPAAVLPNPRYARQARVLDAIRIPDCIVVAAPECECAYHVAFTVAVRGVAGLGNLVEALRRVDAALGPDERPNIDFTPAQKWSDTQKSIYPEWLFFDIWIDRPRPRTVRRALPEAFTAALRSAPPPKEANFLDELAPSRGWWVVGPPPSVEPASLESEVAALVAAMAGERIVTTKVIRTPDLLGSIALHVAVLGVEGARELYDGVGRVARVVGDGPDGVRIGTSVLWRAPKEPPCDLERYPGWMFFELALTAMDLAPEDPVRSMLDRVVSAIRSVEPEDAPSMGARTGTRPPLIALPASKPRQSNLVRLLTRENTVVVKAGETDLDLGGFFTIGVLGMEGLRNLLGAVESIERAAEGLATVALEPLFYSDEPSEYQVAYPDWTFFGLKLWPSEKVLSSPRLRASDALPHAITQALRRRLQDRRGIRAVPNASSSEQPPAIKVSKVHRKVASLVSTLTSDDRVVVDVARKGRKREEAWVFLVALRGMVALCEFALAEKAIGDSEGLDDLCLTTSVRWRPSDPSRCDFERYPAWIFVELEVLTSSDSVRKLFVKPPLERVAAAFRARAASIS
jgi:hypothetical protein